LQKYASKGSLIARTFAIVKFGYARVSTLEQNLDLQLKALKKAGCRMIFREKVSGFIRQRPEFQRILDQIGPGDTRSPRRAAGGLRVSDQPSHAASGNGLQTGQRRTGHQGDPVVSKN